MPHPYQQDVTHSEIATLELERKPQLDAHECNANFIVPEVHQPYAFHQIAIDDEPMFRNASTMSRDVVEFEGNNPRDLFFGKLVGILFEAGVDELMRKARQEGSKLAFDPMVVIEDDAVTLSKGVSGPPIETIVRIGEGDLFNQYADSITFDELLRKYKHSVDGRTS